MQQLDAQTVEKGLSHDGAPGTVPEPTHDIHGMVKWYDAVKGYGFVIPEDGADDILLHHSVMRAAGVTFLAEGTSIRCKVVERHKGLQVVSIVSFDTSTAKPIPSSDHENTAANDPADLSSFIDTQVKWFNRARGYGFVSENEHSEDIFIHMEVLRQAGILQVQPGDRLKVAIEKGDKGLQAREVLLVED